MRVWIAASAAFFVYVLAVTPLIPRLARRSRLLVAGASVVGLAIAGGAWISPPVPLLHDWLLPPALLLLAYWTSGLLFVAPMPRVERTLLAIDRTLRIHAIAARTPRPIAEFLEFAYAGVYPLIPLALIIQLTLTATPDPQHFWTVILITDYICFGVLPWIQPRPPRALEAADPWTARFRRFNVRMLGTA